MGELIVPVLMVLVGGAFYLAAGELPLREGYSMTSASYPKLLAATLVVCAVYLLIRFVLNRRKYIEAERRRIFDLRVLGAFGLFLLFYGLAGFLGYILSSLIFLVLLSLFLQKGKPRLLDTVILPACLSAGLYFVFGFMGIYLPIGSLFHGLF